MSDDTPAITKPERALVLANFGEKETSPECGKYIWAVQRYEAALTASEARVKELEEALRWAIAEINLSTHYDNDEQFESCMVRARAALKGNEG